MVTLDVGRAGDWRTAGGVSACPMLASTPAPPCARQAPPARAPAAAVKDRRRPPVSKPAYRASCGTVRRLNGRGRTARRRALLAPGLDDRGQRRVRRNLLHVANFVPCSDRHRRWLERSQREERVFRPGVRAAYDGTSAPGAATETSASTARSTGPAGSRLPRWRGSHQLSMKDREPQLVGLDDAVGVELRLSRSEWRSRVSALFLHFWPQYFADGARLAGSVPDRPHSTALRTSN